MKEIVSWIEKKQIRGENERDTQEELAKIFKNEEYAIVGLVSRKKLYVVSFFNTLQLRGNN